MWLKHRLTDTLCQESWIVSQSVTKTLGSGVVISGQNSTVFLYLLPICWRWFIGLFWTTLFLVILPPVKPLCFWKWKLSRSLWSLHFRDKQHLRQTVMSPFGVQAQHRGEKKTELQKNWTDGTLARMSQIPHKTQPFLNSLLTDLLLFSSNLLVALFLLQGLSSLKSVFLWSTPNSGNNQYRLVS